MKNIICILLYLLFSFSIGFAQPQSATLQVISPTINQSVTNYGRGFDFTPTVNITIVSLGKRVPILPTSPLTWKIWQVNNQALIHSQTSVATTPTVYTYEPISAPVTLLAGVRYSLTLYGNYKYYYGPSSQINPLLIYHTMRYCNGCYAAQPFPTTLLNNYHYGNPDFMFTTCPPPPAIPNITGDTTVCIGSTNTYTVPAQTGAFNYTWTVPAGATINSGQGTTSLNVTWNAAPGGQLCIDWTDSCSTSPQTCINVTVDPAPTVTVPANATYCPGDPVPASVYVSNPVGGTFTWTNSNTAIGLAAAGAGNTPAFNATNATNAPISGTITVIPTANGCVGLPVTYTITVNPTPTVTVPANATYCPGDPVPASVYVSNPAGATFAWTNSNAAIGLAAAGAGNTPAFNATNATASPIVATITVTPTANGCVGLPVTYTITVNPTPAAPTALSVTICPNNTATLTATAPGGTYEWFDAAVAGNLLFTGASFTTPVLAVNTTYYVQTTVNGCVSARTAVTVTIAAALVVNAGVDTSICLGDSYTLTVNPNGPGYSYVWDAPANLAFSTLFNPTVTPTVTTTYTVTVTDPSNCVGTATVTITVTPLPTVTLPANAAYCNGDPVPAAAFVSNPAGGTFTWTNSNTAIGLAAAGVGNTPAFNATNATTVPIVATITVIPSVNGCVGLPVTYTITVNPGAIATVPANITICNGGALPASNYTSNPTGGTFTWTNSNTAIGLAAAGVGNTPAFNATNTSAVPITSTITVIATANGCPGPPATYTITVNPTITSSTNVSICQGDSMLIGGVYQSTPGSYLSTLTTSIGCDSIVTFNLTINIVSVAISNVIVCEGDSVLIQGNYYSSAGQFPFTFTSVDGCDSTVIYDIAMSPLPSFNITGGGPILIGESANLAVIPGVFGSTYSWTPPSWLSCISCQNPIATPLESTWYYVTVTNAAGCSRIDSVFIEVDATTNLYVPNIFSPNNDGNNDIYLVRGKGVDQFNLMIFNRWGQKVFESESIDVGWDGTKDGTLLDQAVFVYKLNVTMHSGKIISKTGNITLIR